MTGRRIDPDIERTIEELIVVGHTPTAVLRRLGDDARFHGRRLPSLRTLTSMKAALRPRDTDDTWTVGDADPDEAVLVLPVLAELIAAGQVTSVTRQTGRWIARLRRIVPDLPTIDVLVFAARYQAAAAAADSTHTIDVDLARFIRRTS